MTKSMGLPEFVARFLSKAAAPTAPWQAAHQFAEVFTQGHGEYDAAVQVCRTLLELTRRSSISPDDTLGDLIPVPDSLDKVEAMMGVDLEAEPEKQRLALLTLDELFLHRVLRDLLGPVAARCTWDAATVPQRSVRAVVLERARLQALAPSTS